MNTNAFSGYHPAVQFIYFLLVMLFTMFIYQPFFLIIALLSSLVTVLLFGGKRALKVILRFIIPTALLVGILNPMFNHAGVTILWYLPDGNPFTLESLIYGMVSGCMYSSIMLWCLCLRYTITSDRILYLFGRFTPKLGLLLSMILRFLPQFTFQFREVRAAQHCIGRDIDQGTFFRRIKNTVRIVSSVIGWSMENAVNTADSLKSRGYGLPHRTSFNLYYFEFRDGVLLSATILCSTFITIACFSGSTDFYYYPMISELSFHAWDILIYFSFLLLCVLPLLSQWKEVRVWRAIQSKT